MVTMVRRTLADWYWRFVFWRLRRRMRRQSHQALDRWMEEQLRAMQRDLLYGTGGPEPRGILTASGTSPSYSAIWLARAILQHAGIDTRRMTNAQVLAVQQARDRDMNAQLNAWARHWADELRRIDEMFDNLG